GCVRHVGTLPRRSDVLRGVPTNTWRRLLWGIGSLLGTALLVLWVTDFAIHAAPLGDLTLGILLAGRAPFSGLALPEAVWTAVSRSGILMAAALLVAVVIGVSAGAAFAFSRSRVIRGIAWAVGTVGASLPSFFWAMLLQLVVDEQRGCHE